jgi:hypothetical protein
MKARLENHDVVAIDEVHESVFSIDSTRRTTREKVSKIFRLANAFRWVAH